MTPACPPPLGAHDLLRLEPGADLDGEERPDWVQTALAATPWVVVRRAPALDGRIAVGVRGATRDQRWAGWMKPRAAMERLIPEALPVRLATLSPSRWAMPVLAALGPLGATLADQGSPWGPTGSVGFELATGVPTVTQASDLDVLLRCDRRLPRGDAVSLVQAISRLGVRCDLILETPAGGVALSEYARTEGPVAVRGAYGPRLVQDPWGAGREAYSS